MFPSFSQGSGSKKVKRSTKAPTKRTRYGQELSVKKTVKGASIAAYGRFTRPTYFKSHQTGFPQQYTEYMRCVNIKTAAVAASSYVEPLDIIMNGAYRPESGVGTTTTAFAKLMAVYTKCYVRQAKLTVCITTLNNVANGLPAIPLSGGITVQTTTTGMGNFDAAVGGGLSTWKQWFQSPDTITLTQTVDMRKFLGVDDLLDAAGTYGNTVAANPSQIVVGKVFVQNFTATAATILITWTLDMDCVFTDPTLIV